MHNLKAPLSFQIFSGISVTAAFGYYLVGKLYIVPRQNKKLLQKLEVMKMPVETISRKEHRRSSSSHGPGLERAGPSEATLQRLARKKSKSPPPARENKTEQTKKTDDLEETQTTILNETQMTELPPDDTMVSLNETLTVEEKEKMAREKEENKKEEKETMKKVEGKTEDSAC